MTHYESCLGSPMILQQTFRTWDVRNIFFRVSVKLPIQNFDSWYQILTCGKLNVNFRDEWRFLADPNNITQLNALVKKYEQVSGKSFADTDAKIEKLKMKENWIAQKRELADYLAEEREILIQEGQSLGLKGFHRDLHIILSAISMFWREGF